MARPLERVDGPDVLRRAASLTSAPETTPFTARTVAAAPFRTGALGLDDEGRVALDLAPGTTTAACEGVWDGYLLAAGTLRPLPAGATLDRAGRFYWQPGPAFKGRFTFLFVHTACDGGKQQRRMVVEIP